MAWTDVLLPGVRSLSRIADALERIADAMEGKTPLQELPPEPERDPPVIATGAHDDIARAWIVEQQLRDLLGRDPDPEEVTHVMDDIEWTTDDAEAQVRKVRRAAASFAR